MILLCWAKKARMGGGETCDVGAMSQSRDHQSYHGRILDDTAVGIQPVSADGLERGKLGREDLVHTRCHGHTPLLDFRLSSEGIASLKGMERTGKGWIFHTEIASVTNYVFYFYTIIISLANRVLCCICRGYRDCPTASSRAYEPSSSAAR